MNTNKAFKQSVLTPEDGAKIDVLISKYLLNHPNTDIINLYHLIHNVLLVVEEKVEA